MYSGGIAGYALSSKITNCYSTGNIASLGASSSYLYIPNSYSGGIAGYVTNSTITGSYSVGEISASASNSSNNSGSNAIAYSGGITGYAVSGTTITESYSTGDVSASSSSPVTSTSYSGGISGYVSSATRVTITRCAAINKMIGAQNYVGRIVGYITGTVSISNNFALSTMAATGAVFNTTDTRYNGASRTDAQLRTRSTYEDAIYGDGDGGLGWSFGSNETNPWKMPSSGYPIFYWQ